MIFAVGLVVALIVVPILIRRAGHPKRTITLHGRTEYVQMCPECGRPVSECRTRTRQAETATGMGQKHVSRKKK